MTRVVWLFTHTAAPRGQHGHEHLAAGEIADRLDRLINTVHDLCGYIDQAVGQLARIAAAARE
jgi:hypothetical protein